MRHRSRKFAPKFGRQLKKRTLRDLERREEKLLKNVEERE